MAKGRKKTPAALKVIKGTFRKDRVSADMPEAVLDGMKAPAWLPRGAVEHFGVLKSRVGDLGMNSSTYTEMLSLAALCLHEIEALAQDIAENGESYWAATREGGEMKRSNPAVGMIHEARRDLRSFLSEFGLSPAAIQKVGGAKQKPKENPFARFGSNG